MVARIVVETRIQTSPSRCFDLSRGLDLHVESMRHTNERAVAGRRTGLLELGERVTWQGKHFGITHTHTAEITEFDRPRHFRDTMVEGRFAVFEHDHLFEPEGGGTRMTDVLFFRSPLGVLGAIVDALILEGYLRRLLSARADNGDPDADFSDQAIIQGGGIWVWKSRDVKIVNNEIARNYVSKYNSVLYAVTGTLIPDGQRMPGGGGGIWVGRSIVEIVRNQIHDNGFNRLSDVPETLGEGGGIALYGGSATPSSAPVGESYQMVICSNDVIENEGKVGAGIWVRNGSDFTHVVGSLDHNAGFPGSGDGVLTDLFIERNRVLLNVAWDPSAFPASGQGYAGGGLAVIYDFQSFSYANVHLDVLNNNLLQNDITLPAYGSPLQHYGGGMYLATGGFWGASCRFDYDGNYVDQNTAVEAGGIWQMTPDWAPGSSCTTLAPARFRNNTIVANHVDYGDAVSGFYVTGIMVKAGSAFLGQNNVLHLNDTGLFFGLERREWRVECEPQCAGAVRGVWTYSILPDRATVEGWSLPSCPLDEFDIFGAQCFDGDPILVGALGSELQIRNELSPCVDTASPATALSITTDNEGGPRYYDARSDLPGILDRSGDELSYLEFVRGDANADGNVDISDPVHLLSFLDGTGVLVGCQDAADSNDDGAIDHSDVVHLFDYLFSGGAAPPAPFPLCGPDGTPDGNDPCEVEHVCP